MSARNQDYKNVSSNEFFGFISSKLREMRFERAQRSFKAKSFQQEFPLIQTHLKKDQSKLSQAEKLGMLMLEKERAINSLADISE